MTEAMGLILGIALVFQAVFIVMGGVTILREYQDSKWAGIKHAKLCAKAEGIGLGIFAIAFAIAYGVHLHQAAWN